MVIKGISGCPVTSFTKYGLSLQKEEGTPEIGPEEFAVTTRKKMYKITPKSPQTGA